jgi:hypothetical protein
MIRTSILTCLLAVALVNPLCAQVSDKVLLTHSVIEEERDAIVNQTLALSEAQRKEFEPVYLEYRKAMSKFKERLAELVTEYTSNHASLTEEQAERIMAESLKLDLEVAKTRIEYWERFKKVIPARKVAQLYQIENKLWSLIEVELAKEIPLVR